MSICSIRHHSESIVVVCWALILADEEWWRHQPPALNAGFLITYVYNIYIHTYIKYNIITNSSSFVFWSCNLFIIFVFSMYLFNLICLLMLIGLMYSFILFLSILGFRHCLGEILLATWPCDLWVWSVYLVSFFRAFLSPPFWLVFTLLVLFYIWTNQKESAKEHLMKTYENNCDIYIMNMSTITTVLVLHVRKAIMKVVPHLPGEGL